MRCPRCHRVVVRSVDELVCLSCGTIHTPARATDAVEESEPVRDRERYARTGVAWTDAELAWLAENKDRMTARELGAILGRSERAILTLLWKRRERKPRVARRPMSQVIQPQKTSPRARRLWTARQLEHIEDFARPGSVRALSARLGRSVLAARKRLSRLGIGLMDADGMLSARQISREYGASPHRVRRLIASGELPAERLPGTRMLRIDPGDAERVAALLQAPSKFARRDRPGRGGQRRAG